MTDETAAERQRRRRERLKEAGIISVRIGLTHAQHTELKLAAAVNGETMEQNALRRMFGDSAV